MKKTAVIICVILLIVSVFSGCKNNDNKVIDIDELSSRLLNEIEYQDEMAEIELDVLDKFYDIETDIINKCKVYKSASGATAEEIAVFEAKSLSDINAIKAAVSKRVDDLKSSFEDYIPAELEKLGKAKAAVIGRYVILFIVNDVDTARSIVDDYIY